MSLFPDDREVPVEALDCVQVKLGEMELRNARSFDDCWLGCELWRQLQLDQFWNQRLAPGREAVPWSQVLQLLVVNPLIDPGSEFRLHRHWFDQTAMADLLASKDQLYRCLSRLLAHKQDLFVFLRKRWQDLFQARFDVLLYDLTSTYWEGEAEHAATVATGGPTASVSARLIPEGYRIKVPTACVLTGAVHSTGQPS